MTDIEYKQSRITNRGNQYFHYPNDDMEFKNKVANGGWIAHIYKNGIFIDKIEADSSVVWQSPIFTHIKTTTINSKDIEQIYENCKIYAVPKGYEDMLPPKIAFDKDKFLNLIKAFMDKVDELRPTGTTNGTGRDEWNVIKSMENLLQNIGYEPHFSFGSVNLLSGKNGRVCGIAFCRSNTIGDKFVNQKNLVSTGVYIWLGYADQETQPNLELVIGWGEKTEKCIAIDTIEKYHNNGEWEFSYNSDDFEQEKERLANNFLYLVKEFNSIPLEHFKPKGDTMNNQTKTPPLNQILYGPPGTGKTYSTIDKALEILRHYDKTIEIPKSREDKRKIFDKYRANKQIEFVTFHQSFSYEEFVEGIKPNTNNPENMIYEPKAGIFKEICKVALKNLQDSQKTKEALQDEEIFENKLSEFLSDLVENQITIEKSNVGSFQISGFDDDKIYISTPDTQRNVDLKLDTFAKILQSGKEFNTAQSIWNEFVGYYRDQRATYYFQLYNEFRKFEKTYSKPQAQNIDKVVLKPYILIIDEINRGNISKILGELITLIEPSKRIGANDEDKARGIGNESLEVTLPYSNDSFGVPSNLYIIGTMNTADRSIALLDTALRRRFELVEMMPEWDNEHISTDCEGVNLQELLKSMNERIEFLLDREHTIGHSFFIGVDSLSELREAFKLKIIPLLQEYFYDDYAKIQAVLNDNGMIKAKPKPEFLPKFSDEVNDEKVVYGIEKEWQKWESWQFVKIYNSKAAKSQSQDFGESSENE